MSALKVLNNHASIDLDRLDEDNKQDYLFIFIVLPIICIARYVCEQVGRAIFLSSSAAQKIRAKPLALKLAVKKFEEATWKFVYYASMASYGLAFLSWEPYMTNMFEWPNRVSPKITFYYVVQISFYMWMTVCLIWDVRMKDFYQMTTHHVTTLGLLFLSYTWQITHAGCLLMILMDVADPFLELGKICNYLHKETSGLIAFVGFLLAFIFMRLVLYPVYILYPCIVHTWDLAVYLDKALVYYLVNGFMVILFCLNVYWTALILKVLVTKFKGGKIKDVRSDDEMD